MSKNNNFNVYCKHILALLILSVCTFVFNMIEFRLWNAGIKQWQFVLIELSVGLQIIGCAVLGFHFGKKESIVPKHSFNRTDIVRLLLILVGCIYALERELAWKISDFFIPSHMLIEEPVISQFIVYKLISIPAVIALVVFEILYLVAKHTEKHQFIKKRS